MKPPMLINDKIQPFCPLCTHEDSKNAHMQPFSHGRSDWIKVMKTKNIHIFKIASLPKKESKSNNITFLLV
jgi:uncharacterized protein YukJ